VAQFQGRRSVCVVSLAVSLQQSHAGVIYDTGGIGTPDGNNFGGYFSQANHGYMVADDFSLSSPDTIRSVTFNETHWSTGVIPVPDDFVVRVFAPSGNPLLPGGLLATSTLSVVSVTDTGINHNNNASANVNEYVADLDSPIFIPSPTPFFFSVQSLSTASTNFTWQETFPVSGLPFAQSGNNGGSWFIVGGGIPVFQLSNTFAGVAPPPAIVPEPASIITWSLLGVGMIGGGWFQRRRKQHLVATH